MFEDGAANNAPAGDLDPAAHAGTPAAEHEEATTRRDPTLPAAVVGLGASAGGVAALQQFFSDMNPQSGLAFVVVMHLSPDFESQLPSVLQQKTSMPVVQVSEAVKVRPNHVYVIPPNHQLTFEDSTLHLVQPQQTQGKRVTIDLFFRTLAQAYGQRAVCIIMSGTDSDGVIGLKHIRAQGGVTIAQDPNEAEFESMPAMAVDTGMVDWVLPVAQMPAKLMEFVQNGNALQLPPEIPEAEEADVPGVETNTDETRNGAHEAALSDIMMHLLDHTGHDFSHYKRATVLRRIARRLQVNSLEALPQYVAFLRSHSGETGSLLQDLLIGVTHFFRDQEAFASLEANIPQLFVRRGNEEQLRVWVAGCATGEEAYSVAMLLCEQAERLESPPPIQIFATDLDEKAIYAAREGIYPVTIEADVSAERLHRFFLKDQGRYRVKKELREKVLFAPHDLLRDVPFSRLDLITCRNLLIYLNPLAQDKAFDIFHFALRAGGLLFIGSSETGANAQGLFSPLDTQHRVYVRRSVPRPSWKAPLLPARALPIVAPRPPMLPAMTPANVAGAGDESRTSVYAGQERRAILFGELHLKLLEHYGPPSVLINETHDIVHLSEHAGRYLQFAAGQPSANLFNVINPSLRVELRAALYRSAQIQENIIVPNQMVELDSGSEVIDLHIRPIRAEDSAHGFFLVLFQRRTEPLHPAQARTEFESVTRDLDKELQELKRQLNATVEQYEASSEELKASNEELQAMNEEMRSTAEELETSKEELQSVNEELITVNRELKDKLEELSLTNSDLQNLVSATDIGTIFLDRNLRIKRFTPRVQEIFNLLPSDNGRPISHITHKLSYETLVSDAERVLEKLAAVEREVRGHDERVYQTRIAPYRNLEDRISGVVITFVDVTEPKRMEEEARRTAEQFRRALIDAPVPVIMYAEDGATLQVSHAWTEVTGYGMEDMPTFDAWLDRVYSDGAQSVRARLHELFEGERPIVGIEFPVRTRNGDVRHWNFSASTPGTLTDGRRFIVGMAVDITERMEAEAALRAKESELKQLIDGTPFMLTHCTRDMRYRFVSRAYAEMVGRTPEEIAGRPIAELMSDEGLRTIQPYVERVLQGHRVEYEHAVGFRGIGAPFLHGIYVPDRDEAGNVIGWFGSIVDLSERKRMEEALAESEERFRQFAENSADVFWILDAKTQGLEYINPVFEKMFGQAREKIMRDRKARLALIHPDDREEAAAGLPRALAGESFVRTYRIIRPTDGETRWIRDTGFPIKDENGNVVRVAGVAQDITKDRERADALRSSEERFRLLVEGARDYAMFLLSLDNVITYWSAGAERIFGWSAKEAEGQSGNLIFVEEDRAKGAVEKEIGTAMQKGRAPDRRWHRRKDGSRLWVDGVMTRLDDDNGEPRGLAKIARDATIQQQAEQALLHARDQLEQRVLERTADLMATNNELERAMAQRAQLERELLDISERERSRIGQDLHDIVCQELTATALFLKSAGNKSRSKETAKTLNEAAQIVNRNVAIARDLARGFQPTILGGGGLSNALRTLCKDANEREGVHCTLKLPRAIRVRDETIALNLFRIAQEATRNAITHSGGSEIVICIERERDLIRLVVEDNGKGFRPRKTGKGLGLHIMKYRANVLGGELEIRRQSRGGTKVVCEVPVKK